MSDPIDQAALERIFDAGRRAARQARSAFARADIWTDLAICSVMRDGMLRRTEASGLDWEHIRRDPEGASAQLQEWTFRLSPVSIEFLDAIERSQRGPVFVSRHGRRAGPRTICRRIKRAAERAGLTGDFGGDSPRWANPEYWPRPLRSTVAARIGRALAPLAEAATDAGVDLVVPHAELERISQRAAAPMTG